MHVNGSETQGYEVKLNQTHREQKLQKKQETIKDIQEKDHKQDMKGHDKNKKGHDKNKT